MKKLLLATAMATAVIGAAQADSSNTMSVTDFLLDWKNYKNSQVTVKGCAMLMVGNALIYCYSDSSNNLGNAFAFMGENLPREDRKVLLSGCTLFPANCVADVTGTASRMILEQPTLLHPTLKWTKKPD
jgi:hypothetical protein